MVRPRRYEKKTRGLKSIAFFACSLLKTARRAKNRRYDRERFRDVKSFACTYVVLITPSSKQRRDGVISRKHLTRVRVKRNRYYDIVLGVYDLCRLRDVFPRKVYGIVPPASRLHATRAGPADERSSGRRRQDCSRLPDPSAVTR